MTVEIRTPAASTWVRPTPEEREAADQRARAEAERARVDGAQRDAFQASWDAKRKAAAER
jgi:hypothetical protein